MQGTDNEDILDFGSNYFNKPTLVRYNKQIAEAGHENVAKRNARI
jgi:hypothetical protein